MIDISEVKKDFISISGLSPEEAEKQNNLFKLAINHVKHSLKPGVDVTKNQNLLSMLAASIAYHKYVLIKESCNLSSSIKIGDIAVSSNSKEIIKTALTLKKEFFSLASHLLFSPKFIFRQV